MCRRVRARGNKEDLWTIETWQPTGDFPLSSERYNELTWFAVRYAELKMHKPKQAAMIEQAAKTAEPVLWPYILRNVTQGAPYHSLLIPCGRNLFYTIRRRFFAELDKLRG